MDEQMKNRRLSNDLQRVKATLERFRLPLLILMLGGILLGVIENLSKAYISSQLSDAIVFAVLIIVLLIKPAGMLGKQIREKV